MLVVDMIHLIDRIEKSYDIRCAESTACANSVAADLFDHTDVPSLMAPGFIDIAGVQGHACQPGTVASGFRVPETVGPNESPRSFGFTPRVEEARVRREVGE